MTAAVEAGARPWLDIRDLRVWFPVRRGVFSRVRAQIKAVDGVTLAITRGETIGLAGESGCGKSTLGRALVGLENPCSGSIHLEDRALWRELSKEEARRLRRRIQMVFQDPFAALNPRLTIEEILTEGLVAHGLLQEPRADAARRLLADVGMDADALQRYPFEFSGGQRQRICIARALSLRPDFIICDEVVSALDVSVQAQVINLLMDLRDKYGLAYLVISHDLSVLRHVSHRIAVMYLGRLMEVGPADAVVEQPRHPYTRALLAAVPVPGETREKEPLQGELPSAAHPPAGCPFHPRCPRAMEICRRMPPPAKQTGAHTAWCHL